MEISYHQNFYKYSISNTIIPLYTYKGICSLYCQRNLLQAIYVRPHKSLKGFTICPSSVAKVVEENL